MNLGAALRSAAPSLAQALTLRENLAQKYANDELERERNLASLENMRTDNALKQAQLEAAKALKDEQTQKLNEQNKRLASERPKIAEALANLKLDLARSKGVDPESMAINKAMAQGPEAWTGNMSVTPELQAQAEKPGFGDLLKKQQEGQILASPEPAKATSALDALASLNPPTKFMKPRDMNPLLAKNQFREYGLTSGIATSELPEAKAATSELDRMAAASEAERLARIAAINKGVGRELKINDDETNRYIAAKKDFETKLLAARGQLGKMNDLSDRVDREMVLIDEVLAGKTKMTPQLWRELNTGFNTILGGSNAVSQIEELTSSSVVQDLQARLQYMSNQPVDAVSPEFVKGLRHSLERIRNAANEKKSRRIDAMLKGWEGVLSPVYIDKLREIGASFTASEADSQGVPEFATPEEAEAANLPAGTKIKIGGRPAVVE